MSDMVLVEDRGLVRWISINRPDKRNAMNEGVIATIRTAIESADMDDGLRALVLTGTGEKAFCAGADLGPQVQGGAFDIDYADPRHYVIDLFKAMEECRLPIIARVNGLALAGGFGLVCACDMAVAADDVLFGTPETKVGVAPMMILGYMMRILPRRKLMEMCINGEFIGAGEALQLGIVNYIAPRAELDEKLAWLLDRITAKSPTAIKLFKQGYHSMQDMNLKECFEFAQIMISVMASTNDAKEGRLAFQEKRPPVWRSGR